VGLSIGIASLDGGLSGVPETLVRAADRALYVAKQGGKNRVAVAPIPA
jgi:PleD family two-component response regulator